jgi:DNA-binding response OmpR family regulator
MLWEVSMKKILVIDDDPSIQDATRLIFERNGYEVNVLPNGDSLFDNNYELPDIFILDKQLRGIDGLDICSFLKSQELTKNIPVIMLSAAPNIGVMAKLSGANDALEKPFRIRDLRDMVEMYIN